MAKVLALVGTRKGAFILESDGARRTWRQFIGDTSPMNHVIADSQTGVLWGGGGSEWFGPAVWRSDDLGETWTHSREGLAFKDGAAPGKTPMTSVWSLAHAHGALYAGVSPAALFRSDDDGLSWREIDGLQNTASRGEWNPGGAGLILHTILPHPADPRQMWVGISAAGVFHTADGGETWEPRNRGTRADFMPEDQRYPEFGQCVHHIAMAAGQPERLYQQNHCGMYRSDDAGLSWRSIENGLPSSFGFPAAVHPRDPDTAYLMPLNGDIAGRYMPDARAAVWRTRDGGANWRDLREGLPQRSAYFGVLRQAMACDAMEPAGVYFGTSSGSLYVSADEGDTWACAAEHLPTITSVETLVMA
jgi:photosystem II stability/assembly factor-like uncharacterized protein